MGKNTMIRKCIREYRERKGDDTWMALAEKMVGNVGVIFTTGEMGDVKEKIKEFVVPAPAKAGAVAQVDVVVPAGPTGMEPSQTNFFQTLNIATKINKGAIEILSDVTVVTDMNTGRSRGFGFVTVPDQAVADACIAALDGADVDGRAIRVNVSVAREDRPPRSDRPPRDGQRRGYDFDGRKVYFGNLSWGMDHLDLQDLCGEFGTVEDARLITDRETNRSRGFGFVTMSTVAEAEEVVNQLNGQDVDGRVLRVNIANVDK